MAFGTSTGSPCRLQMKRQTMADGRSVVALGSNEVFAVFFPVRNLSLPEGKNLTSLALINERIPFKKNTAWMKPTGCAPRCSTASDAPVKELTAKNSSSKSSGSSKRKTKCSCLSNETPAQGGGGNLERCRRPRHCRPAGAEDGGRKKNHDRTSSTKSPARGGGTQRKKDHPAKRPSAADAEEATQWILPSTTTTTRKSHHHHHGKKKKNKKHRHHKQPSNESKKQKDRRKKPLEESQEERRQEEQLRLNGRRPPSSSDGDIRLIRHMYRKIRAHPELAEEFLF